MCGLAYSLFYILNFGRHGEKISHSAVKKETEIQVARGASVFSLRQKAGIYASVSSVPDMFSRAGKSGSHSGN